MLRYKKLPGFRGFGKAHPGDAGWDLYARDWVMPAGNLDEDVYYTVRWGDVTKIPTGIEVSSDWEIYSDLREKSGLALNHGMMILGGIIDPTYRGELIVLATICVYKCEFSIKPGDKIAQLIPTRISQEEFLEAENLDETERGSDGFGSTGR